MRVLKGVVLGLILANVLYFLWAHGIESPFVRSAPPAPTLRLASEVAPAPAAAAPASQPSASDATAGPSPADLGPSSGGAASAAAAAPAAQAAPAATRCISIGPFLDVAEAARAAATLRGGGYQPRQRVAEGEVWAGVWVYVPLPAAAAARAAMRAKLEAAGIDDALEMPGPKDVPVMSLGLFSEPRRADTRIRLARSLGFDPAIADRKRTGDVYWVDVDLKPSDQNLNPADLDGESGRIVRLQIVGCPGT